jgi:hypothetical protein
MAYLGGERGAGERRAGNEKETTFGGLVKVPCQSAILWGMVF